MFLELIATFVAGFAGAGVVLLVNKILGGRLPRWMLPVGAGATMLLTTIFSEYGWYSRTANALPEGIVVAETVVNQSFYRPWTYVRPFIERFVAVDVATIRTHPDQPGIKLAETYFFGRWSATNRLPVLADCVDPRRAALADAISFEQDGNVLGADWVKVPEADPLLKTICGAS